MADEFQTSGDVRNDLKLRAKRLKKDNDASVSLMQCQNELARSYGFKHWGDIAAEDGPERLATRILDRGFVVAIPINHMVPLDYGNPFGRDRWVDALGNWRIAVFDVKRRRIFSKADMYGDERYECECWYAHELDPEQVLWEVCGEYLFYYYKAAALPPWDEAKDLIRRYLSRPKHPACAQYVWYAGNLTYVGDRITF